MSSPAMWLRIARTPPAPRMCAPDMIAAWAPGSVKLSAPAVRAFAVIRSETTARSSALPMPYCCRAAMIRS